MLVSVDAYERLGVEIAVASRNSGPVRVGFLRWVISLVVNVCDAVGAAELDSLATLILTLVSSILPIADFAGNEGALLEAAADLFAV